MPTRPVLILKPHIPKPTPKAVRVRLSAYPQHAIGAGKELRRYLLGAPGLSLLMLTAPRLLRAVVAKQADVGEGDVPEPAVKAEPEGVAIGDLDYLNDGVDVNARTYSLSTTSSAAHPKADRQQSTHAVIHVGERLNGVRHNQRTYHQAQQGRRPVTCGQSVAW